MFNYKIIDILERLARLYMAYVLISNCGVGIITPLEDLNLPRPIYIMIKSMWDTGFLMHTVKAIELFSGVMFLFNVFIPLTLIILMPVVVNIYGMHIFVFKFYFTNGLAMFLICLFLIYRNKKYFYPLLTRKSI